jgi:hypothetical protein
MLGEHRQALRENSLELCSRYLETIHTLFAEERIDEAHELARTAMQSSFWTAPNRIAGRMPNSDDVLSAIDEYGLTDLFLNAYRNTSLVNEKFLLAEVFLTFGIEHPTLVEDLRDWLKDRDLSQNDRAIALGLILSSEPVQGDIFIPALIELADNSEPLFSRSNDVAGTLPGGVSLRQIADSRTTINYKPVQIFLDGLVFQVYNPLSLYGFGQNQRITSSNIDTQYALKLSPSESARYQVYRHLGKYSGRIKPELRERTLTWLKTQIQEVDTDSLVVGDALVPREGEELNDVQKKTLLQLAFNLEIENAIEQLNSESQPIEEAPNRPLKFQIPGNYPASGGMF